LVDGRYHQGCGCFHSISTSRADCFRSDCIFSRNHPPTCKSSSCVKYMSLPFHHPIRHSPLKCADCARKEREGSKPTNAGRDVGQTLRPLPPQLQKA
ncbi:hypothetical protein BOTBODRAFT_110744, partial [Botryobasidium botryosum FD-172 SS1]